MNSELLSRIFDHVENGDVDKAVRASLRLSRQISDYMNTALFLRDLVDDKNEIFRVLSDDTSHLRETSQKYIWEHSYTRWLAYRTLPFAASVDNDTGESRNILVVSVGEFPEELKQCEKSIADMAIPPTMGEYDSAAFTDRYDVVKSQPDQQQSSSSHGRSSSDSLE